MKRYYSLMAAAIVALGLSSCTVEQEDTFSTAPVAPEFIEHNDILITANTLDEDVNFSWTAYRNLPDGLPYNLWVAEGENAVKVESTTALFYKTDKTSFKDFLYRSFSDLPDNDTFSLDFYVTVENGGKEYRSAVITLKIYALGNAIAPVITLENTQFVLDPNTPDEEVVLLSWEPARLVYGERITYTVSVRVGDKEEVLSEDVTGTSFATTMDALNEAIVAAGGVEAAENEVVFTVKAACESFPEGVTTVSGKASVTTYLATFPEQLYLPGSYQGWAPATAPEIRLSSTVKGLYEGFVDLRTADGSPVLFKFSPVRDWVDDFGGKVEVDSKQVGQASYSFARGTVGVPDNIEVPSGIWFISLNRKTKALTMVEYQCLSLIGTAVSDWNTDVPLDWDAAAGTFTAPEVDLKAGEFKIRFNNDWDFSLGGTLEAVSMATGGNIVNEKEGAYKIVLNTQSVPFTIKLINTSFPDQLYVPGSHNGWNHAANVLAGNGEGQYEGFLKIGGEWGFKLTDRVGWKDDGAQVWGFAAGTEPGPDAFNYMCYQLAPDGGNIMEGTQTSYQYVRVDLSELTVSMAPVQSLSIIGGFDGWAADYVDFTYDEAKDVWKASAVEIGKGIEFKIRANHAWDTDNEHRVPNLGGSMDNLVEHGGNIKLSEGGVYDIELHLSSLPFKATLTKVGDVDEPDLPENMYMVGEGIVDWSTFVAMTPFNGINGAFWAIRYLEAGKQFKFSPNPAWQGDFYQLDYNEGVSVSGTNLLVEESGIYCIGVDYAGSKIIVEPAKVYGMGGAWGGNWTPQDASKLFTVSGKTLVGTATTDGNIRTYVDSKLLPSPNDWWRAEFTPEGGQIVYRGTGGDPADVPIKAGQKIIYDFNAGTGVIE